MELAKAYVQIIPSAQGLNRNLTQAMGGEVSSAGNAAGLSFGKNLVGAITKVVAAASIGAFIKKSIDAGGALQQSFGGLDTIYGEASEAAKEYAYQAAQAGISANSYAEQAVSMGASLKQAFAGDTTKAIESANMAIMDMTDNAAKMGTDISLVQNAYNGLSRQNFTMLDNLKLGYQGTAAEMARLINDSGVMGESFKATAENVKEISYDKYIEAIHVVQGELGLTGVAAQEASETFTGSMGAMKAAWDNVLSGLSTGGDIREPLRIMFENARVFLQNNMFPMLLNVLKGLPALIEEGLSFGIRMINLAAQAAPDLINQGVEIVGKLVVGLISAIPYLAESALNLITAIADTLINGDWITIITNVVTELKNNFDLAAGEIFGADNSLLENISQAIITGIPTLAETAINVIDGLVNFLLENLPALIDAGLEIVEAIAQGLTDAIPNVIEGVLRIVESITGFIADHAGDIVEAGIGIIKSLVQGLINAFPKIIETVPKIIINITRVINENMPKILKAGLDIIVMLAKGIINNIPVVIANMGNIVKAIIGVVEAINWLNLGSKLIKLFANGIKALLHFPVDFIKSMVKSFIETITGGGWSSLGSNIISGIANGILNAASAVIEAAKSVAGNIFAAVASFFKIGSPSKLMADEIGRWIPAGIAEGIEDNMSTLRGAMSDMEKETTATFNADVVAAPRAVASQATTQPINYGGVTINVQAESVERSRDFVEWLEGQLAQRTNNRRAGALA